MIETKDLKISFGELKVLKGITQTIKQGEKVVIIGPSGSGKSTFLRILSGYLEPSTGDISIPDNCAVLIFLKPQIPALFFLKETTSQAKMLI